MKYYLLTKEEFASLYRFGAIHLRFGGVVESDSPEDAVKKLFTQADPFEYAQERVILTSENGAMESLKMKDVKDIYPLDDISKNLFESQFNSSIIFKEPLFKDFAESFLQNSVMRRETVNGINALRFIFEFDEEQDTAFVDEIVKGKSFLRKWKKYYDVPLESRTPFSILIAYNRYRHYPKDSRGFFLDAADCFMYATLTSYPEFLGFDRDIVAANSHSYQQFLEDIPSNTYFVRVAEYVENSGQRICDAIAKVYGSVRFVALYFYVKEKILEENTISMVGLKLLNSIKKKYPEDFPKLITLIGGFFGYSWIYDRFYEFSGTSFLSVHHSLSELEKKEPVLPNNDATLSDEPSPTECSNPETETLAEDRGQASYATDEMPSAATNVEEVLEGDTTAIVDESTHEAITEPSLTSVSPNNPEQGLQDLTSEYHLDIDGIINSVFTKKCTRKSLFYESLVENHDTVLKYAMECDEKGLRNIYPILDTKFRINSKDETEVKKLVAFVQACHKAIIPGPKASLFTNQD